jgi:hypothetical protein
MIACWQEVGDFRKRRVRKFFWLKLVQPAPVHLALAQQLRRRDAIEDFPSPRVRSASLPLSCPDHGGHYTVSITTNGAAFQLGVGQLGRVVLVRGVRAGAECVECALRGVGTSHPSPIACFTSCAIGLEKVLARGRVWRPVVAFTPFVLYYLYFD